MDAMEQIQRQKTIIDWDPDRTIQKCYVAINYSRSLNKHDFTKVPTFNIVLT